MRIIDWKQMKEMHLNPYSRQHTKRLEDAGLYPKRVRIGNNRVGWVRWSQEIGQGAKVYSTG